MSTVLAVQHALSVYKMKVTLTPLSAFRHRPVLKQGVRLCLGLVAFICCCWPVYILCLAYISSYMFITVHFRGILQVDTYDVNNRLAV